MSHGTPPRRHPRLLPDGAAAATVAQPVTVDNDLYVRDYAKCILCYKCVEACGADAPCGTCSVCAEGTCQSGYPLPTLPESEAAGATEEILTRLRPALDGKIVVTCANPLGFDEHGAYAVTVPKTTQRAVAAPARSRLLAIGVVSCDQTRR